MAVTTIRTEVQPEVAHGYYSGEEALPLRQSEESEALSFLAQRPLHTVYMGSLIRDNGVESIFNRGRFYSYRDSHGRLEGIALLGHATLIEAHSESALNAFAHLAKHSSLPHLIRGEEDVVKRFWSQYGEPGQVVRCISRELLMEQIDVPAGPDVTGLRLATLADLEDVTKVNAEMAKAESGSDPLERDPKGFRYRIARRIALGRNWIWTDGGKLLFKADIIADTPQAIYLEGIYVDPSERGRGYGSMCLSQLGKILLRRTCSICLTLNASNDKTKNFYLNAGYTPRSYYDTIYLQPAQ